MKKIGFIDYYLSEWHANNYPNWLKDTVAKLGVDYTVAYAWGELETSPVDGVTSAEWCEKYGVELCSSIEEVCEKSDYILILAPSNPEKHLPYARVALTYGKNTYIDKTFAPNSAESDEMFAIAEKHGTKFFSTSALRYAEELDKITASVGENVTSMIISGGGSNLPEYIVHIVEMLVKLIKDPVKRVRLTAKGIQKFCDVETVNGKTATLIYSPGMAYTAYGENAEGKARFRAISSPFFNVLMENILNFYETGEYPFDPAQTREVMRTRDAILKADTCLGTWVEA